MKESKPVQATPELFEEEEDYFDLAAELEEGLLNVQSAVKKISLQMGKIILWKKY